MKKGIRHEVEVLMLMLISTACLCTQQPREDCMTRSIRYHALGTEFILDT